MTRIVILGGGFAGVVAAESLAQKLDKKHEITLISRQREFTFYPDLVRLAFGQCRAEDVFFDLEGALLARHIRFIQAEIIAPDPLNDKVIIQENGRERSVPYDYLVLALGRRLAVEEVKGFQQHAHHLLSVGAALRFGEAVKVFHAGHAIIGACPDARLAVPLFETAFALDRMLNDRNERKAVTISLVLPEQFSAHLGGTELAETLHKALALRDIHIVTNFPINLISEKEIWARDNRRMPYDLLMLLPPFAGPEEAAYRGLTDETGFVEVSWDMKARGTHNVYAAGDCVSLLGPKMGHLAVLQAEIVALNLAAEIEGRAPEAHYEHEIELIINEGGTDSLYLHKELWTGAPPVLRQGRFWSWAKQIHSHYWTRQHQLNPISKSDS